MKKNQLGIALVGLGKYSTGELAPALEKTSHCKLAGVVTGSEQKAREWKEKYRLADSNIYNYKNFDKIKDNPDIDIVYVVLPNAMHAEYVIRAANAGKHVICEKPMAVIVEDCERMITACRSAGVQLAIGYRLHFEPHNREAMRLGQEKTFGKVTHIKAEFGLAEVEGWRLDKKLAGGGPLMDVGIYCVQAARYTSGLEPVAVTAVEGPKHDHEKFKTVEESISWKLEFPGGLIAESNCSYAAEMDLLHADAENGWFELSPAYEYEGITGKTSKGPMQFPQVKEQAVHMDGIAKAILENKPVPVPGEMGMQDVKILQAIYEAARTGKRVEIR
jgi:predicted dehydrogenase